MFLLIVDVMECIKAVLSNSEVILYRIMCLLVKSNFVIFHMVYKHANAMLKCIALYILGKIKWIFVF